MSSFELVRRCETINLYRSGAAAKLEFNRPGRLNALSAWRRRAVARAVFLRLIRMFRLAHMRRRSTRLVLP